MIAALPSEMTDRQKLAFSMLLAEGQVTLNDPCDCGSHIRHNNGGNYHLSSTYRLDGGRCFKRTTSSSEYDALEPGWQELKFSEAVDEIAELIRCGLKVAATAWW